MNIPILYEDEFLLGIDKPSGIAVNRSENERGETVQDWAEGKLKIKRQNGKLNELSDFYNRAGIVHRLDKETSGVLLIAKDEKSFVKLQEQFKARLVGKSYFALVHGKIEAKELSINAPVARLPWNRRKFGVLEEGREAETFIRVKNFYEDKKGNRYTFIEAYPKTGRTHQIRIHLKHIQHPIVADSLYVGRKQLRMDLKIFPRLFLHAYQLKFLHPESGKQMEINSSVPSELMDKLIVQLTRS